MSGIFYDPNTRRLHKVKGAPDPSWALVTHNLDAGVHQCRRILREFVPLEELRSMDWSLAENR